MRCDANTRHMDRWMCKGIAKAICVSGLCNKPPRCGSNPIHHFRGIDDAEARERVNSAMRRKALNNSHPGTVLAAMLEMMDGDEPRRYIGHNAFWMFDLAYTACEPDEHDWTVFSRVSLHAILSVTRPTPVVITLAEYMNARYSRPFRCLRADTGVAETYRAANTYAYIVNSWGIAIGGTEESRAKMLTEKD